MIYRVGTIGFSGVTLLLDGQRILGALGGA